MNKADADMKKLIRCLPVSLILPSRIPDNFPQMAVGVLEITRIPAPKRVVRRQGDGGAGLFGFLHDPVHLFLAAYVVAQRKFGRTGRSLGNLRVMGQIFAAEQGEPIPGSKSKNATAPCSNSCPTMPSVWNPRPSR